MVVQTCRTKDGRSRPRKMQTNVKAVQVSTYGSLLDKRGQSEHGLFLSTLKKRKGTTMKAFLRLVLLALCLPVVAHAAEATDKDAVALVQKALAYAKTNGTDKLVADVNAKSPEFTQGELYVVIVNATNGLHLAHPFNQKLIGINAAEMQDVDGHEFGKDMMELANGAGKGWVNYMFKNPVTNKVARKKSYVEKAGNIYVVAGIYTR
jgi:cytochrome c